MQVAYITRKVFADDSEEIRIKQNKYITRKIIEQGLKTKIKNKIERKLRNQRLCDEINKLNLFDPNYAHKSRILIKELKLRNIQNVNRSAHRKRRDYSKKYYMKNHEKELQRCAEYRLTHREEINARKRAYRAAKKAAQATQQSPTE